MRVFPASFSTNLHGFDKRLCELGANTAIFISCMSGGEKGEETNLVEAKGSE